MYRAVMEPRNESISEWEERAAGQAAGEMRGGGERGLKERRKFMGSSRSMGDFRIEGAETVIGAGSTNKPGAIAARSESWQQDIEQAAMPGISWLQSMGFAVAGEECW
jgi:hypothetical protein